MWRKRLARTVITAAVGLLVCAPGRLEALSYVSVEAGKMLLSNPSGEGDVSPLLSAVGAAVPLVEVGLFRFELGALLWGTRYEYVASTGAVVPTQVETAEQIGVLGLWISPLAGVHFALAGGKIELGVAAGPSLNLRFPIYQTDIEEGESRDIGAAYRYFFAGRFLFPETRLWIRWMAFDDFSLSLSLTALYPLFHLWDGGEFLDQFTMALVIGFDIRLPKRAAPAAAPEVAPKQEPAQAPASSEGGTP